MKTMKRVTVTVCDFCGKSHEFMQQCHTCGKDACFSCQKDHMASYAHEVYCSGSGDGHYCRSCDKKHRDSGKDNVWNAFKNIQNLRVLIQKTHEDLKAKAESAKRDLERVKKSEKWSGN